MARKHHFLFFLHGFGYVIVCVYMCVYVCVCTCTRLCTLHVFGCMYLVRIYFAGTETEDDKPQVVTL